MNLPVLPFLATFLTASSILDNYSLCKVGCFGAMAVCYNTMGTTLGATNACNFALTKCRAVVCPEEAEDETP